MLADNQAARAFYRARGWTETGERRESEYPRIPIVSLRRQNPHAPRRSL